MPPRRRPHGTPIPAVTSPEARRDEPTRNRVPMPTGPEALRALQRRIGNLATAQLLGAAGRTEPVSISRMDGGAATGKTDPKRGILDVPRVAHVQSSEGAVRRKPLVDGDEIDLPALLAQVSDPSERVILANWGWSRVVHDFTTDQALFAAVASAKAQTKAVPALYRAANLAFLTQAAGRLPTLYFISGTTSGRIRQQHGGGPAVLLQSDKTDYFFESQDCMVHVAGCRGHCTRGGSWDKRTPGDDRSAGLRGDTAITRCIDFAFSISGLVVVAITSGTAGLRVLLGRLTRWRFGVGWYALALLPVWLYALATFLAGGTAEVNFETTSVALFSLNAGLLVSLFLRAAMGEELGLRGFALPRLEERLTPVRASLIIGVLWGLWHLPVLFSRGPVTALLFLVLAVALSFIFTLLFHGSGGSLIPVLLFHATQNWEEGSEAFFPNLVGTAWETPSALLLLLSGVVAGVLLWRRGEAAARIPT